MMMIHSNDDDDWSWDTVQLMVSTHLHMWKFGEKGSIFSYLFILFNDTKFIKNYNYFLQETFLPDKYILPSTSSESEEDQPCQHLTPLITQQPKTSNNDDQSLLPFTPLKNSSNRLNKSLTPATRLQALKLDDSPEDRRDSVFFAQSGCLGDDENIVKDNLISFSPLSE